MADEELAKLGAEFKDLRAESVRLRARLSAIRTRLTEIRPEIQMRIVAGARAGERQIDLVRVTGYTRDNVRKICRDAGIEPTE